MATASSSSVSPAEDRQLALGEGLARIPERLLLAHSKGQVLFISGAGTSRPSGLPDFKNLVLDAYVSLDGAVHSVLDSGAKPGDVGFDALTSSLSHKQRAEVARYFSAEYDVVLGMLERRIDSGADTFKVRQAICNLIARIPDPKGGAPLAPKPSSLHRSLMALADRGGTTSIVTTNFDRLLQSAALRGARVPTYALGAIPRPGRSSNFSGVLHVHGHLPKSQNDAMEIVVTDRDFGEYYLRRRVVPDFIYDAARLYHLVLVGYSASDAPMRYLLNAVAADGSRFDDLKERFAFVESPTPHDETLLEDWRGRGITPIPYSNLNNHVELSTTFARWAELSPLNGKTKKVDAALRAIVSRSLAATTDQERDLFEHLYRRSPPSERIRIAGLLGRYTKDGNWLRVINRLDQERVGP